MPFTERTPEKLHHMLVTDEEQQEKACIVSLCPSSLLRTALPAEARFINDIDFHDLRHDFAHRARQAGWSLEEVASYLGHITKSGMPAIQTTIRYTQVSRKHVKEKLKLLQG